MVIIGGCALSLEREPHRSVEIHDFQAHQSNSCELQIPARGATAHIIDNKVYVIGGCKGPKEHLVDVQSAQIIKKENSDCAKTLSNFVVEENLRLNKERSCHMSVFSEKERKLYVLGGFDGWECLKDVEMVDFNKDRAVFEALPDMPCRVKNGVAVLNEQDQCIYIFGGWDEKETMNTVFKFDPKRNTFEFDGNLPKPVEGHACIYVPETQTVFVLGGFDGFGVTDRVIKYELKSKASSIIYGLKLACPRENHTAQLVEGDRVIVSNGWNGHESLRDADMLFYDRNLNTLKRGQMTKEDSEYMNEL